MARRIMLKILPLEGWMSVDDATIAQSMPSLTSTAPIFNRNGWYRTRNSCWFEYNGRAFLRRADDFDYCLRLFNHRPLRPESRQAIRLLMQERLASRELRELYHTDTDWRQIRDSGRMARKWLIPRLKAFKLKHHI